jgi:ornithine cyclodeaminase
LRYVDAQSLESNLTIAECVRCVREALIAVSDGHAVQPLRTVMPLGDGNGMGSMSGALRSSHVHGIKLTNLYPGNPAQGRSSHLGLMVLFDSTTGECIGVVDGSLLTAMRTAAASVVATQALARPNPRVFAIFGTGEQAQWHARAFCEIFDVAEMRVWARDRARAEAFVKSSGPRFSVADDLRAAVAGADVLTTVTASREAFLPGELLQPGQHVNLVGASMANAREIDDEGVAAGRLFTDSRVSAEHQAGELLGAIQSGRVGRDHLVGEIGEVLSGAIAGRVGDSEITIFKSHGVIAEDLAVAKYLLEKSPYPPSANTKSHWV